MRRELKILNAVSGFYFFAAGMFGPIFAIFVEDIGGGLITAGTAYSIFCIVAGILIYIISKWEDHIKHQEKLVVFGYLISCFGFLGYILIKTPMHLYITEVIFGLATAIRAPAFSSLYSKHLDHGKFASEWGVWEAIGWIVVGISAIIGSYLAKLYGFRVLFFIMLLISLMGLVVSVFLMLGRKRRK